MSHHDQPKYTLLERTMNSVRRMGDRDIDVAVPMPSGRWPELLQALGQCTAIYAKDVFLAHDSKAFRVDKLPPIAPPGACYWIEGEVHGHHALGQLVAGAACFAVDLWRFGFHTKTDDVEVVTYDGVDYDSFSAPERVAARIGGVAFGSMGKISNPAGGRATSGLLGKGSLTRFDGRWLIVNIVFLRAPKFRTGDMVCYGEGLTLLDEQGAVKEALVHVYHEKEAEMNSADAALERAACTSILDRVLETVALIGCHNVELVDAPERPKLKRKKGKPKPYRIDFRVLDVRAPGSVKRQPSNGSVPAPSDEPTKRRHVVRGHFADYRERGLFGKYRGVFYIPEHQRGSDELGQVLKDYNVVREETTSGANGAP